MEICQIAKRHFWGLRKKSRLHSTSSPENPHIYTELHAQSWACVSLHTSDHVCVWLKEHTHFLVEFSFLLSTISLFILLSLRWKYLNPKSNIDLLTLNCLLQNVTFLITKLSFICIKYGFIYTYIHTNIHMYI